MNAKIEVYCFTELFLIPYCPYMQRCYNKKKLSIFNYNYVY